MLQEHVVSNMEVRKYIIEYFTTSILFDIGLREERQ